VRRSAPVATLRPSGSRARDASHDIEKICFDFAAGLHIDDFCEGKTGVAERMKSRTEQRRVSK
jgi:hypothetical protein